MDWHYTQPVTIHFGNGQLARLGEEIRKTGKTRGLLITSPFFGKNGLADRLMADSGGTLCATYRQVSPNPDIRECDDCIRLIHENHCDFIVALGGGSVLDCAKAAAAFSNGNHPAGAYLDGTLPVPTRGLPLIAIPTTAGTGSEVSRVTVLSDHAKGIKAPLFSPAFYPVCAIIDPELTRTLPKAVTACTGMDVLCHAIEAYWSIHHQPICDALAIHAARLVMHHLETACENPGDMHAREKMAEASVTAGLAFARPGTTASHACSLRAAFAFGSFLAVWACLAFKMAQAPFHADSDTVGILGLCGIAGALTASAVGQYVGKVGLRNFNYIGDALILLAWLIMGILGDTYTGMIAGIIIIDIGIQCIQLSNQSSVMQLNPKAANRVNTVFMTTFFIGGTFGTFSAGTGWQLAGWTGVVAVGIALALLSLCFTLFTRH